MTSKMIVQTIIDELLTLVVQQSNCETEPNVEFPPGKKLRLAKLEEKKLNPLPQMPNLNLTKRQVVQSDTKVAKLEVKKWKPLPQMPNLTKGQVVQSGTEVTNSQKFTAAKKIAELKADRDHWKNLCLSSRVQTEKERQARLELQRDLEVLNQKLSEQSEFCHEMGSLLAEVVWTLSQSPPATQYLEVDQIENLMLLICGTVDNFVLFASSSESKESRQIPESESRLVSALVGIASNLAGSKNGRKIISANSTGCDVTDSVANVVLADLNNLSIPVQEKLHRLALCFIYNMTTNRATLAQVVENTDLVDKIEKLSNNPLSTFRQMAESIIRRLGSFGKAERFVHKAGTAMVEVQSFRDKVEQ